MNLGFKIAPLSQRLSQRVGNTMKSLSILTTQSQFLKLRKSRPFWHPDEEDINTLEKIRADFGRKSGDNLEILLV
jgi:hypothetical protein